LSPTVNERIGLYSLVEGSMAAVRVAEIPFRKH
jgi:hypothetical protein